MPTDPPGETLATETLEQTSIRVPDCGRASAVVSTGHSPTEDVLLHRTTTILATVALALTGTAALSACGPSSDERRAAETLEAWFDHLADRDAKAACALMSKPEVRGPEGELAGVADMGCEALMTFAASVASDRERELMRDVEVTGATVEGDRATVGPQDLEMDSALRANASKEPVHLRKRGGRWLLEEPTS